MWNEQEINPDNPETGSKPVNHPGKEEPVCRADNPGESAGGLAESHEALPPPPEGDLQKLDERVIRYWQLHSLIASSFLLGGLLVVFGILLFGNFWLWPYLGGAWVFFFLLRLWLLFWYPPRAYRAWSYRVDDKVLETRHGIWFKVITLLPLSRLQHVDLERGPLERSFGLATLSLHTAGTQNATIPLPGLDADEAARLRDQLVAAGGDDGV